jgi:uncharacterized protein YdiU (UPF0061 family)
LCRVAENWARFGTVELFHFRGEQLCIRELVDYIINNHLPNIKETVARENPANESQDTKADNPNVEGLPYNKYALFFQEVVRRSAETVAHWYTF